MQKKFSEKKKKKALGAEPALKLLVSLLYCLTTFIKINTMANDKDNGRNVF